MALNMLDAAMQRKPGQDPETEQMLPKVDKLKKFGPHAQSATALRGLELLTA